MKVSWVQGQPLLFVDWLREASRVSSASPSSDLMEERLREANRVSSASLSSDLMEERLLWSSDLMVDDRLLWSTLGLSLSLATEVTHSTKEAGEGDLFVEDFFDFSPLCS